MLEAVAPKFYTKLEHHSYIVLTKSPLLYGGEWICPSVPLALGLSAKTANEVATGNSVLF